METIRINHIGGVTFYNVSDVRSVAIGKETNWFVVVTFMNTGIGEMHTISEEEAKRIGGELSND